MGIDKSTFIFHHISTSVLRLAERNRSTHITNRSSAGILRTAPVSCRLSLAPMVQDLPESRLLEDEGREKGMLTGAGVSEVWLASFRHLTREAGLRSEVPLPGNTLARDGRRLF